VPNGGVSVLLPLGGSGLPLIVTLAAFFTSQRIVAILGPGPGGTFMVLGLMSKATMLGGSPDDGVVEGMTAGVVDGVEEEDVTVMVSDCELLPELLLAVSM
jgi:hypothetical protein